MNPDQKKPRPYHYVTDFRCGHFYAGSVGCILAGFLLADLGNIGKLSYDWRALVGIILVLCGIWLYFFGRHFPAWVLRRELTTRCSGPARASSPWQAALVTGPDPATERCFVMPLLKPAQRPTEEDLKAVLRINRSLAKFIRDHDGVQSRFMDELIFLIEAKQYEKVADRYGMVHFGAYGFNDWQVPVIFSHETSEYVQEVFRALTEHWKTLMMRHFGRAA